MVMFPCSIPMPSVLKNLLSKRRREIGEDAQNHTAEISSPSPVYDPLAARGKSCLIAASLARQVRAQKAIEVLGESREGLMWVHLLKKKTDGSTKMMIPIRWTTYGSDEPNSFPRQGQVLMNNKRLNSFENLKMSEKSNLFPRDTEFSKRKLGIQREISQKANIQSQACCLSSVPPDDESSARTCVICLTNPTDVQLLPCTHDHFCRQCIMETICSWTRPSAPSCPLCRSVFDTMVLNWAGSPDS
mmetsp:Transcript_20978/g.57771  ORF Transcript_20978/g.57771 Transcript_20978/m.57771 type:complete len:245 (-) Transcript_20978:189-923(-)